MEFTPRKLAQRCRRSASAVAQIPGVDVGSHSIARSTHAQRRSDEASSQDALGRGAQSGRSCGAARACRDPRYFYEPYVLARVPGDARLLREEIFGPVAPVATFSGEAGGDRLGQQHEYGLVAYVYTRDLGRAFRVIEGLQTGMVGLNQGMVSNAAAPFGRGEAVRVGREGGFEGIGEYLETKYVAMSCRRGKTGVVEAAHADTARPENDRAEPEPASEGPSVMPAWPICRVEVLHALTFGS